LAAESILPLTNIKILRLPTHFSTNSSSQQIHWQDNIHIRRTSLIFRKNTVADMWRILENLAWIQIPDRNMDLLQMTHSYQYQESNIVWRLLTRLSLLRLTAMAFHILPGMVLWLPQFHQNLAWSLRQHRYHRELLASRLTLWKLSAAVFSPPIFATHLN
jgi:hypothetical protein